MSTGPQNAALAGEPRCSADIDVHFSRDADGNGVFRFAAPLTHDVEVHEDGTIRLRVPIGPNETARLAFTLLADSGEALVLEGIRLGSSESEAEGRPPAVDTRDEYYFDTPFKMAPDGEMVPPATLVLTQVGPLMPSGSGPYYYLLSLRDGSGRVWRHDPKIYNEGDGDPG